MLGVSESSPRVSETSTGFYHLQQTTNKQTKQTNTQNKTNKTNKQNTLGGTDQYMLRIFRCMQSEGFGGIPSVKDGVAESAAAGVQDVGRIPHLPIG